MNGISELAFDQSIISPNNIFELMTLIHSIIKDDQKRVSTDTERMAVTPFICND